MSSTDIVMYGAGGCGRDFVRLVESAGAEKYRVVCFVDDNEDLYDKTVNGLQVMSLQKARENFPSARIIIGIAEPNVREKIVAKAASAGFQPETFVHPTVQLSRWQEIGEGVVIG